MYKIFELKVNLVCQIISSSITDVDWFTPIVPPPLSRKLFIRLNIASAEPLSHWYLLSDSDPSRATTLFFVTEKVWPKRRVNRKLRMPVYFPLITGILWQEKLHCSIYWKFVVEFFPSTFSQVDKFSVVIRGVRRSLLSEVNLLR